MDQIISGFGIKSILFKSDTNELIARCQSNLKRDRNVYLAVLANGNAAMKHAAGVVYRRSIEKARTAKLIDLDRYASLINETRSAA